MNEFWVVVLVIWCGCGCFTAKVAGEKGYSTGWWFLSGFIFGFVALIGAAGLPDRLGGQNFAVGQQVYARGTAGTVIRIDRKTHQVLVDTGNTVLECRADEVFPKV